jgi:membrane-associated phospholipid phosphatase
MRHEEPAASVQPALRAPILPPFERVLAAATVYAGPSTGGALAGRIGLHYLRGYLLSRADPIRWWARVSGGVAAVGVLLLTELVYHHHTRRIDSAVLRLMRAVRGVPYARLEVHGGRFVQVHPAPILAPLARVLGAVGTPEGAVIGLLVLGALLWRSSRRRALALPVLFAAAIAVERLCKARIVQFEPGATTSLYPYVYHFSYPSGHALAAFFFAVGAGMLRRRRWVWLTGLTLALAVALSRLYTGEHWFSDVVGGGLLGWSAAALLFVL